MKICPVCGKEFMRPYAKYCSETCKKEADKKRACEKYRQKESQPPRFEKTCKICGKKFKTNLSHKRYCSPECYNKNARDLMRKYAQNHYKAIPKKPTTKPPKKECEIYDFTKFDFSRSKETIPKACLKCAYCRTLTGSNCGIRVCHYCIDTGDPRGCSTKECVENKIHFKPRPRKKRQKVGVI